ncbi:alpha/beta fold hydrolase [Novosphingobium profundi]|uniref:alpha/beta fold hydrolase n=1 Tax=Novosphingobium profundi TaxID=1774954 RepID=UPI001BDA8162|nr:alpha/beta fold hydrolase [Novosphingobium profundi]MBT0671017.1 alpha/beta fold hydrolase [Novosphingobium profundi]
MVARIRRDYVPCRYGQLHLRISRPEGQVRGRPLLCLHQTPSNGADWTRLSGLMGTDRVVLAPDTPGYGQSDGPEMPATIPELAAAIREGIEHFAAKEAIDLEAYDVIGHHTGSVLATELALHDKRVNRLVLCSLPVFDLPTRQGLLDGVDSMFAPIDGSLARAEQLLAFQSRFADPRLDGEQRQIAMAECLRLGARMDWAYRGVFAYDFAASLLALGQHALVLNCDDDLAEPTRQGVELLGNAGYRELAGWGHGYLALVDAAFVQDIRTFLDASAT